jgi:hypothetical protein
MAVTSFHEMFELVVGHQDNRVNSPNPPPVHALEMKQNLSALRLIHFLSVALLVERYVGPTARLLQGPVFAHKTAAA